MRAPHRRSPRGVGEETEQVPTDGDGQYLYWRVGMASDGEFRFFVAGD